MVLQNASSRGTDKSIGVSAQDRDRVPVPGVPVQEVDACASDGRSAYAELIG